jgi:hypothetical protein
MGVRLIGGASGGLTSLACTGNPTGSSIANKTCPHCGQRTDPDMKMASE